MDPAEYPAPGAPPTTGTGSSGEENKENHDDDATRTPNSRKKGRGMVYSCKIVLRFVVMIHNVIWCLDSGRHFEKSVTGCLEYNSWL